MLKGLLINGAKYVDDSTGGGRGNAPVLFREWPVLARPLPHATGAWRPRTHLPSDFPIAAFQGTRVAEHFIVAHRCRTDFCKVTVQESINTSIGQEGDEPWISPVGI